MRLRLVTFICAVAVAATGCTPSGSEPTTTDTAPTAATGHAAVWREFVDCARNNGQANWPDPVVDAATGRATFPPADGFEEKVAFEAVRTTCGSILERLPAQANPLAQEAVTPERMELLRQYSDCMRKNGMPDFPDPDAEGNFLEPTTGDRQAARAACDGILVPTPGQ